MQDQEDRSSQFVDPHSIMQGLEYGPGAESFESELAKHVRATQQPDRALSEQYAVHLKDSAAAMSMFASLKPFLTQPDVMAYRLYRDSLLSDYGDPQGPDRDHAHRATGACPSQLRAAFL